LGWKVRPERGKEFRGGLEKYRVKKKSDEKFSVYIRLRCCRGSEGKGKDSNPLFHPERESFKKRSTSDKMGGRRRLVTQEGNATGEISFIYKKMVVLGFTRSELYPDAKEGWGPLVLGGPTEKEKTGKSSVSSVTNS